MGIRWRPPDPLLEPPLNAGGRPHECRAGVAMGRGSEAAVRPKGVVAVGGHRAPARAEIIMGARSVECRRYIDVPSQVRADKSDHARLFALAAERAGLTGITLYSLRHSSIVRALLANVPARVVAALHDTSLQMLEATYSAFISEFGDSIARKSLLEIAPPKAGKVVPLGRRS